MSRVLVAMSGGVDSSVAAARLVRAGHEVIGATLHLWDYPDDGSALGRCCAPEDIHDARRVADVLGIPHYAFDHTELFRRRIVEPFIDAYLLGTTPSPCVECNRSIKVQALLRLADRFGADRVATGHYARIVEEGGIPQLHRGRDRRKDQSYFLHTLGPDVLRRLELPLGESTKEEVRSEAASLELPGAGKGESQELCFVPSGRYDEIVEREAAERIRPGNIVDSAGNVVGRHAGVHRYTVGQRRNLGIAVGHRAYVVAVEAETATVRLGSDDALLATRAVLTDATLAPDVALPLECEVAVRYRGSCHFATVAAAPGPLDAALEVRFRDPVRAVVPGQFAVFYEADRVLGGGRICSADAEGA